MVSCLVFAARQAKSTKTAKKAEAVVIVPLRAPLSASFLPYEDSTAKR